MLTRFKHAITNAVSEGLNSKIQIVKSLCKGVFTVSRVTGTGFCFTAEN
nr:transposase [Chlorobaculum thiosulfatiphilum]